MSTDCRYITLNPFEDQPTIAEPSIPKLGAEDNQHVEVPNTVQLHINIWENLATHLKETRIPNAPDRNEKGLCELMKWTFTVLHPANVQMWWDAVEGKLYQQCTSQEFQAMSQVMEHMN